MKFFGDIELNENELQNVVVQKETAFPSTAKIGRLSFIDQVLYMCVDLNGTDPIWYPLTNKINTYEHTQSTSSTTWNVAHNLNSLAPIVQVMVNGSILIPESVAVVDKNNITITFGSAVSGTATVMFGNVLSPLGTGIMNPTLSGKFDFIDPLLPKVGWRLKFIEALAGGTSVTISKLYIRNINSNYTSNNYQTIASPIISGNISNIYDNNESTYLEIGLPGTLTFYDTINKISLYDIFIKAAGIGQTTMIKTFDIEYSNNTTNGIDGIWTTLNSIDLSTIKYNYTSNNSFAVISNDNKNRMVNGVTAGDGTTTNTTGTYFYGVPKNNTGRYCFEFTTYSSGQSYGGVTTNNGPDLNADALGNITGVNGVSNFYLNGNLVGTKSSFFTNGGKCLVLLDLYKESFTMIQNNTLLGTTGDNSFGSGISSSNNFYPFANFNNATVINEINIGNKQFDNLIPTGYKSWDGSQSNYATKFDVTTITDANNSSLSNNDLTFTTTSTSAVMTDLYRPIPEGGKYYLEINLDTSVNNTSSFFSAGFGKQVVSGFGIGSAGLNIGISSFNGNITSSNSIIAGSTSLGAFTTGILQIFLDADNGTAQFALNNSLFSGFFNVNYMDHIMLGLTNTTSTINTGSTPFAYSIPNGYKSFDGSQ